MVMQETRDNERRGTEDGRYARTEEELYKKAIALLEKCKIETQRSVRKSPEAEFAAEVSPIVV